MRLINPKDAVRTRPAPFLRDDRGTAAIEYALIIAIIGVAVVAGASQIDPGFTEIGDSFEAAVATAED